MQPAKAPAERPAARTDGCVVVCHQLRSAENLGALARVLGNFGVARLVLSEPATHDFRAAAARAVGAEAVLEGLAVAASLEEALSVSGVVFALGTTSRREVKRRQVLSLEEAMALLRAQAERGPVALVLGGEKRGLSDADLAACQAVTTIDTPGPQPSMNLSHAGAVLLHAWARACAGSRKAPDVPEGAPLRLVQALEAGLQRVLGKTDFLNPQAPGLVLAELSRSLVRGGLTRREAELWLAAVDQLERALSGPSGGR